MSAVHLPIAKTVFDAQPRENPPQHVSKEKKETHTEKFTHLLVIKTTLV